MDQENFTKNWLTSAVLEYSCKSNFSCVIEKILKEQDLSSNLHVNFSSDQGAFTNERQKVKPVFLFIQVLRKLLSSVETFATETSNCYPWNSDDLPKIVNLLERTYEQCEFISLKKFFSLLSQLKFLDLMHLLRSNVESAALMQKLNLHFPRWHSTQKASLEKQFSIDNPKVLVKVEESFAQCRRLILKLVTDASYRSAYMSEQFSNDMKKMMMESVILLKEIIANLSSNAGLTVIEKSLANEPMSVDSGDIGHQLLLDYLQPDITPESLLRFLNEMEPALEPPSGGFSSCLLPFDTLSECSEAPMDSDESDSESCSEDDDEKEKTLVDIDDV